MSKIAYDPTKDRFASWIRRFPVLRVLFYRLLDMFFLRSWYVRSAVKKAYRKQFSSLLQWDILDAGNGFGQYDHFLLRSFSNAVIHAVDVKEDYLEDCARFFEKDCKTGRVTFEKLDLVNEKLPQESVDLSLCIDVLEHIEEDVQVMKNIRRALRPGGLFIMHSPSHFSEEDAGEEDDFFVEEHARAGYSKEELNQKFVEAGLTPVAIHYSYGKWGHAAWVMLVKVPMLWFTRFRMWTLFWLPFYYALTLLPGLSMMAMDMRINNKKGTGILGIARKEEVVEAVK
ncbi:methyltransferase domain-containing protein [Balneolaceae bacterium ANBcel3]|nr:methyltransferase domain-containing protein [Balneolaceae bacterium ANBcel3]